MYKPKHQQDRKVALQGLKRKRYSLPVEEHTTAAWANIERQKPESGVHIPSGFHVVEGREWVEENKK